MKPEESQRLVIDVATAKDGQSLLDYLLEAFNFPDLYERSWHGFSEHLFYDSMQRIPAALHISGLEALRAHFPDSASQLERCLKEHLEPNPDCKVTYDLEPPSEPR